MQPTAGMASNPCQTEKVAPWNGWIDLEKGLQLATCLRVKAQKVLSELKPSQKSNYITLLKESLMDFGCEVPRLAQKAYPEFPYEALDQVSQEQFVRGLYDVDMKRHVELRNPSSLEEAISLAT